MNKKAENAWSEVRDVRDKGEGQTEDILLVLFGKIKSDYGKGREEIGQ